MAFYADLHVHSKYSRATSRDGDLQHLALWGRRKGLTVVGTGDFTHPAWFEEIRSQLVPAEPGLFRLRPEIEREVDRRLPPSCPGPVRFMLEVEISTIYKKGDRTRKVHHLIYAASLATAARLRERLGGIGNLAADGRPILGLDSRHLLEITLDSGPDAYLVPAHIWTPWFAALGSQSGFDSIEECYGDLTPHIFAVETGLSSDPPMNRRVSGLDRFTLVSNSDAHSPPILGREACAFATELDYFAMRRALETGEGFGGTVEFFPEEGKYHLDGHRACGVRLEPAETRRVEGRCPVCGKALTIGVMHRVEALADRPEGDARSGAASGPAASLEPASRSAPAPGPREAPFRSLVPLPEVVAEIRGVGPKSKSVEQDVAQLVGRLGPEIDILERLPLEDVARAADGLFVEALSRLRAGRVRREAGYDGEYGVIRLFEPDEIRGRSVVAPLFAAAAGEETARRRSKQPDQGASPLSLPSEADAPRVPPPWGGGSATVSHDVSHPGLLDALDPDQRAAAEVVEGPLLIVAGPGTGKTRTLSYRLAHLIHERGVPAAECLAVTFSRRAAAELEERLAVLLPEPGDRPLVATFHGLGLTMLREQAEAAGLSGEPRVATSAERAEIARQLFAVSPATSANRATSTNQANPQDPAPSAAPANPEDPATLALPASSSVPASPALPANTDRLLEEISALRRRRGIDPAAPAPAALAQRLAAYEEALAQRNLLDFDDLLLRPLALLRQRPDLAAAYRERWRWISIDEYQDIDALQYSLVRLLAPPAGNLCAIGDPDQSIYGFRGADVQFFLRFERDYPQARVVHLTRNYRSTPRLVEAACRAIRPASLVPDRRLVAAGDGNGDGHHATGEPIVVQRAASERAEAELVVHTLEQLLGGTSYFSLDSGRIGAEAAPGTGPRLSFGDVAILYRTEAQAPPLLEALGRAGIPFQKRSHRPLADQPGVGALLKAVESFARQAGDEAGETARSDTAPPGVEAWLEKAVAELSAERRPGSLDRPTLDRTALAAAAELLRPLALRAGDDLASFLADVAIGGEVDAWDPRAERVSLLTLHAAKGLEFPVVFLVGCEDGLLPLRWPGAAATGADPEEQAEERRLFFVGITRARARLYLFHSRKRTLRGQTQETRPSPFLADLADPDHPGDLGVEHRAEPALRSRRPEQLPLL